MPNFLPNFLWGLLECQCLTEGSGGVTDETDSLKGWSERTQGLGNFSDKLAKVIRFLFPKALLLERSASLLALGACDIFFRGSRIHPHTEVTEDEDAFPFVEEGVYEALLHKRTEVVPRHSWGEKDEMGIVAFCLWKEEFSF